MMYITQDAKSAKVENSLLQLKNITNKAKRAGLFEAAVIFKNQVVHNVRALPRYGNIDYYNGKKRRASRPYESFANRSKDAERTLGYDVKGSDYAEIGFRSNEKTKYVIWLEEGTDRMLPRPTLQIGAKETAGTAQVILTKKVMQAHIEAATS